MTNVPYPNVFINIPIVKIGFITFLLLFFSVKLLSGQTPEPDQNPQSPSLQEQETEIINTPETEEAIPETTQTLLSEDMDRVVEEDDVDQQPNENPSESVDEVHTESVDSDNLLQSIDEEQIDSDETNTTIPIEEEDTQKATESEDSEKTWRGQLRIFKLVNDYQVKSDEILTTLVMIAGNASIHGTVTGNVLIIGGNVELASGAYIKGKLHVIGGQVIGDRQYVENISEDNGWKIIPAATKLLMHPHTVWDLRKHSDIRITIAKFVFFTLAYLLLVLVFPKPINAISTYLTRRPLVSILFGALTFIVIPVVAIILILSIIGIPCLMLGICLIVPFALCGKAGIFFTLGGTLLAGRLRPLSVIFGYIPYFMATEIPYIDWITFIIFNTIGIGLCILLILSGLSNRNQRKINNWTDRIINNAV
ncbi:hypothetical protein JT359_18750 [Candidatus Poribacteria bacterium]|nr:hypothetical protein [Candidatus Poribacteria bacterium]